MRIRRWGRFPCVRVPPPTTTAAGPAAARTQAVSSWPSATARPTNVGEEKRITMSSVWRSPRQTCTSRRVGLACSPRLLHPLGRCGPPGCQAAGGEPGAGSRPGDHALHGRGWADTATSGSSGRHHPDTDTVQTHRPGRIRRRLTGRLQPLTALGADLQPMSTRAGLPVQPPLPPRRRRQLGTKLGSHPPATVDLDPHPTHPTRRCPGNPGDRRHTLRQARTVGGGVDPRPGSHPGRTTGPATNGPVVPHRGGGGQLQLGEPFGVGVVAVDRRCRSRTWRWLVTTGAPP